MKALVGSGSGGYRLADDMAMPSPNHGMMLIQVHAVALSPYDAKAVDYSNVPGAVGGCDFAGTVVQTAGVFAGFALATEGLSCHVPANMSFEQASAMGLGIATAGLALFQAPGLALPLPRSQVDDDDDDDDNTPPCVLVSDGATATGTMATQLLNMLHPAMLDTVTDVPTMRMCYEAIGPTGGTYIALEATTINVKYTRRDVRADWLMTPTFTGAAFDMGGVYDRPATPEHRAFGAWLFKWVATLLAESRIKNHPLQIREGSLFNIPTYVNELWVGNVRAKRQIVPLVS